MVNSEKGEKLIEAIFQNCVLKEVEVEKLWIGNTCINKNFEKPLERNWFYEYLEKYGFIKTVKKIEGQKFLNKIKMKIFS